jgi:rhamnosyltransferase
MSILDQEGVFIDLFISDDFSSDLTVNIIKKINKKNIILLRPKSRLGSPSKNFFNLISSVDIAKYDFFSFSDQDDIWFKDKIFKAIKLLNKIKASGYSSNFTAMWENGKKINFRKDYNQKKFDYIFESAGPGCSYLIRKDLFLELQVFTKINSDKLFFITAHDWFIYAFARSRNFKWVFDKSETFFYRQHSLNSVGVNFGIKAYYSRLRRIISGEFSNQVWLTASILGYENVLDRLLFDIFCLRIYFVFVFLNCRRRLRDAIFLFIIVFCGMLRKPQKG